MHVLFADDSEDIRRLFGLSFRFAHHTARLVENGAEAVAAVEGEAFDIIMLDMQMPIMDGWEALRRIRELPNGRSVPIALISAIYDRIDMQQGAEMGANIVFPKPLYPSVILTKLEELVQQNREKQASQHRSDSSHSSF